jgi:catechol 2,3-dioxygenase-like lactoylglutathione lyase family enzyme
MIIGAHTIIYSKEADKDRAFFKDVLGFDSVDAGHGWLIFALPPAELAVHPADVEESHELYLMCDDIQQTVKDLKNKKVACSAITQAGWGSLTTISLPGGGKLGLYEPRHEMAITIKR